MKNITMRKTITYIIPLVFAVSSCKNKDLCYDDHLDKQDVNVVIHWKDGAVKPAKGMMVNLFPLGNSPKYGMAQLPADGGPVKLVEGSAYFSLCYDYYAENIYFRNEYNADEIEAYCSPMVRATYSRNNPGEHTVTEPDFPFWVDRVDNFPVDGNDLHFYPDNVVEVFTFEIRGINGAQHISATRGGIGGMSGSYFLSDGTLSAAPTTVLFDAKKDGANGKITGSFRTFGALNSQTNKFTIEILYPSQNDGIIYASWDVTDQVRSALHIPGTPDIIIENRGEIPPIEPDDDDKGSGFDADVERWEDVYVPIPM